MNLLNYSDLVNEQNSWKFKMEHFKQENVLLKYRLSEMVDDNEGNNFLQKAEYFQNELLIVDVSLDRLSGELEKFSGLLRKNKNDNLLPDKIKTEYNKLKKSWVYFEDRFLSLSKEFTEQMLENPNR